MTVRGNALVVAALLSCTPAASPAPNVDAPAVSTAPSVDTPDASGATATDANTPIDRGSQPRLASLSQYEAPKVAGDLPPEEVRRVVRQSFPRLRDCYEPALVTNPTLAGFVVFELAVDKDGHVSSAKTNESEITDATVIHCLLESCKRFVFPKPASGKPAMVTFHVRFQAAP